MKIMKKPFFFQTGTQHYTDNTIQEHELDNIYTKKYIFWKKKNLWKPSYL